jgi:hypothetical protein
MIIYFFFIVGKYKIIQKFCLIFHSFSSFKLGRKRVILTSKKPIIFTLGICTISASRHFYQKEAHVMSEVCFPE